MSRVRTGHGPDDWALLEPAKGRTSHTRFAIRGGGPPIVVAGALAVGESAYSLARRAEREHKARAKS